MLNIVADDVKILQLIDGYQREYLEEVKRYKERPTGERNSAEMEASKASWFESVSLFAILTIQGKNGISSNIYIQVFYISHNSNLI